MGNLCSLIEADEPGQQSHHQDGVVYHYNGERHPAASAAIDQRRASTASVNTPDNRKLTHGHGHGAAAAPAGEHQEDVRHEVVDTNEHKQVEEEQQQPLDESKPFSWTKGELLGIGAFGRVFQGLNNVTGELIAVKQVGLSKDEALRGRVVEHVRALEAEVHVLKQLKHENIVQYLGTERVDDAFNIVLEYVPGGSIASLLAKFGPLQESVIRVYTRQILKGLEYLHQRSIMHRDIKGANILVDKHKVKLADFGASKKIEDLATMNSGCKSIRGTPYWMAPEVIKQTGHGRPADIWSVGCTVIEMATGKPPWSNYAPVAAMFQIASSKSPPPIPDSLSPEAKDFLALCFNRVPKERANATRLLKHPFVAVAASGGGAGNGAAASAAAAAAAATAAAAAALPRIVTQPSQQQQQAQAQAQPVQRQSPPHPTHEEACTPQAGPAHPQQHPGTPQQQQQPQSPALLQLSTQGPMSRASPSRRLQQMHQLQASTRMQGTLTGAAAASTLQNASTALTTAGGGNAQSHQTQQPPQQQQQQSGASVATYTTRLPPLVGAMPAMPNESPATAAATPATATAAPAPAPSTSVAAIPATAASAVVAAIPASVAAAHPAAYNSIDYNPMEEPSWNPQYMHPGMFNRRRKTKTDEEVDEITRRVQPGGLAALQEEDEADGVAVATPGRDATEPTVAKESAAKNGRSKPAAVASAAVPVINLDIEHDSHDDQPQRVRSPTTMSLKAQVALAGNGSSNGYTGRGRASSNTGASVALMGKRQSSAGGGGGGVGGSNAGARKSKVQQWEEELLQELEQQRNLQRAARESFAQTRY